MTGQELFYALNFVDEKYVAEAQNAYISSGIPWKKLISAAACLCILIAGAFAMKNMGVMDKAVPPAADAPAAAAPMTEVPAADMPAADAPAADAPLAEESITEYAVPAEPETIPGELHHVAFAHLRILNVLEDGSFEVYVEKVADEPRPFDAGVTMTLVIDPDMIPATDRTDLEYSGDVNVDMLVEIQNGAYDAGINTLYAEGIFAAARE